MSPKIDRTDPARILFIVFLLFMATAFESSAQQTMVRVNAPERISKDFDFTIDVDNALDLDSGQFDLEFDPGAIQVLDVKDGSLADQPVPIRLWTILKPGRIRVIFNFPGVRSVSGTGHLAKINARAIGKTGEITGLDIQRGLLVDQEAKKIPTGWISSQVKIQGTVQVRDSAAVPKQESGPEPKPQGVSISTSMVLAGLAVLVALPGLFLVLFRKTRKRS